MFFIELIVVSFDTNVCWETRELFNGIQRQRVHINSNIGFNLMTFVLNF